MVLDTVDNQELLSDNSHNKYILKVEDNSDSNMMRAKVYFKNGHTLSIIKGEMSYGGDEGLFEIMASSKDLIDLKPEDDFVRGRLSSEEVNYYIKRIGES